MGREKWVATSDLPAETTTWIRAGGTPLISDIRSLMRVVLTVLMSSASCMRIVSSYVD